MNLTSPPPPMSPRLRRYPSAVVMQPGTFCNLDCRYCYLPARRTRRRMSVPVAEAVAATVNAWAARRDGFEVFWHAGEPLAVGRAHLAALLAPFRGVTHVVQSNATLIDDAWCAFFDGHGVRVGVSVDGPVAMGDDRHTPAGRSAFGRILDGIACLRRNAVPFSVLAVVADPDPGLAGRFYEFFVELGPTALGVSIEQRVGAHTAAPQHDPARVSDFWAALAQAWADNPAIRVREIDRDLRTVRRVLAGDSRPNAGAVDPLPTITTDGDVVLIAPELAGFQDRRFGDFGSGNVLADALGVILAEAPQRTWWLADHLDAVRTCLTTCRYAGFCDGPSPAADYFEHGHFHEGATSHCRTTVIARADAICRPILAHAAQSLAISRSGGVTRDCR